MKKYLLAVLLLAGCEHKREGEIIKTQDGKLYRLEAVGINEAYIFKEIDTASINKLSK